MKIKEHMITRIWNRFALSDSLSHQTLISCNGSKEFMPYSYWSLWIYWETSSPQGRSVIVSIFNWGNSNDPIRLKCYWAGLSIPDGQNNQLIFEDCNMSGMTDHQCTKFSWFGQQLCGPPPCQGVSAVCRVLRIEVDNEVRNLGIRLRTDVSALRVTAILTESETFTASRFLKPNLAGRLSHLSGAIR